MFGIAGDYIGTDSSQTIEEILKEKSCDILKNKNVCGQLQVQP